MPDTRDEYWTTEPPNGVPLQAPLSPAARVAREAIAERGRQQEESAPAPEAAVLNEVFKKLDAFFPHSAPADWRKP